MVLGNGTVVSIKLYLTIAVQYSKNTQNTVELEIAVKLNFVVSVEVKFLLFLDGKEPVLWTDTRQLLELLYYKTLEASFLCALVLF